MSMRSRLNLTVSMGRARYEFDGVDRQGVDVWHSVEVDSMRSPMSLTVSIGRE